MVASKVKFWLGLNNNHIRMNNIKSITPVAHNWNNKPQNCVEARNHCFHSERIESHQLNLQNNLQEVQTLACDAIPFQFECFPVLSCKLKSWL